MKLLTIAVAIISITTHQCWAQSRFILNPVHFIESARSVVTGLGNQVAQKALSPRSLFRGSKQLLFGLPELAVFRTIHELCK